MPIFQKIKNLYGKLSNIDNKIYNGVVRQNYHNLYFLFYRQLYIWFDNFPLLHLNKLKIVY